MLSDPALYQEWRDELKAMSLRIQDMRTALYDELTSLGTPGSWTHITSQIGARPSLRRPDPHHHRPSPPRARPHLQRRPAAGMFSFTGLSPEQCTQMVEKHHVYMLNNGRVSMAGVTSKNVKYIAKAIDDVVRNF